MQNNQDAPAFTLFLILHRLSHKISSHFFKKLVLYETNLQPASLVRHYDLENEAIVLIKQVIRQKQRKLMMYALNSIKYVPFNRHMHYKHNSYLIQPQKQTTNRTLCPPDSDIFPLKQLRLPLNKHEQTIRRIKTENKQPLQTPTKSKNQQINHLLSRIRSVTQTSLIPLNQINQQHILNIMISHGQNPNRFKHKKWIADSSYVEQFYNQPHLSNRSHKRQLILKKLSMIEEKVRFQNNY